VVPLERSLCRSRIYDSRFLEAAGGDIPGFL
jgi:hypothetical protein